MCLRDPSFENYVDQSTGTGLTVLVKNCFTGIKHLADSRVLRRSHRTAAPHFNQDYWVDFKIAGGDYGIISSIPTPLFNILPSDQADMAHLSLSVKCVYRQSP